MQRFVVWFAIAMMLAFSAESFAQSNVIANPGFESGTTSWLHTQTGTATVIADATHAHSGNNYGQLVLAGSATTVDDHFTTTSFYTVSQGQTLNFGGWAFLVSGNGLVRYSL